MQASILVVEDEPSIQELISVNLTLSGHDVVRANDAESAIIILSKVLPDLMLVDWMLPGQSGINLVRSLRSQPRTRDLPIIMLTARSEQHDKVLGLESGADDYMTKPFSPRELLARIQALMRRRSPHSTQDVVESSGVRLDPAAHRVTIGSKHISLGPTEFKLLLFLMKHPDRIHSRTTLLDKVWGNGSFVEERTVDTHVGRLRSALEVTGHDVMIETIRGSGYRFSENAQNLRTVVNESPSIPNNW
jgi:two-component system phosphate regulon response regulator PhoB